MVNFGSKLGTYMHHWNPSHGSAAVFSMEYFHSMASLATNETLWFLQMLALCATARVQLCL